MIDKKIDPSKRMEQKWRNRNDANNEISRDPYISNIREERNTQDTSNQSKFKLVINEPCRGGGS